jgi:hypothetical protein
VLKIIHLRRSDARSIGGGRSPGIAERGLHHAVPLHSTVVSAARRSLPASSAFSKK